MPFSIIKYKNVCGNMINENKRSVDSLLIDLELLFLYICKQTFNGFPSPIYNTKKNFIIIKLVEKKFFKFYLKVNFILVSCWMNN